MKPWALIPVKRFAFSKTRLASLLTLDQRNKLAQSMLEDTLETVSKAKNLAGVAIVTADPLAADIAKSAGMTVIHDTASDLNGALTLGREALNQTPLLILPIDLPALRPEDIDQVVDAGQGSPMVIVADHHLEGTNALLLSKSMDLTFAYGPGSFARHVTQAKDMGVNPTALKVLGIACDFDAPADLPHLINAPLANRTLQLLSDFGLLAVENAQ